MPMEKKVEFLRSKLTPRELEETLKRLNPETDDLNQFFEPNSEEKQSTYNTPQRSSADRNWKFSTVGLVGAVLVGATASSLFLNAPSDKRRKSRRKKNTDIVTSEDTAITQNMQALPQEQTVQISNQNGNPLMDLIKIMTEQQNIMKEQQLKTNELLETLNKKLEKLPQSYTPHESLFISPKTSAGEVPTLIESFPKEEQISSQADIQPIPTQPISIQPIPTQPISNQPVPIQPISNQPVPTQPISTQPIPTRSDSTLLDDSVEPASESSVDIDLVFTRFLENCAEDELRRNVLKVLRLWFTSMIRNPEDKRKTRINISTPDFKNIIKKVPDHLEFFTLLGFTSSTSFLEFDAQYLNRLERVLTLVNSTLETLAPPVSNFIMSAPWKRAESLEKPEILTSSEDTNTSTEPRDESKSPEA